MDNYGRKSTFASFLPGIAGIHGIPLWCMYVNRGQCVAGFGARDKDHAIMEFYPAHKAYEETPLHGFRTFLRISNEEIYEPFNVRNNSDTKMDISENTLTIAEENKEKGIKTEVTYFILPEEPVGALVRRIKITNIGERALNFTLIDGMPEIIPYGVNADNLKNMTETSKAFMEVKSLMDNLIFAKVRASMADSAEVKDVPEGNFAAGFTEELDPVKVIYDSAVIFGFDTSLEIPAGLTREVNLDKIKMRNSNIFPCAFFTRAVSLKNGESTVINELYGEAASSEILIDFVKKSRPLSYFDDKLTSAIALTDTLTDRVATETASKVFDDYTRMCYLDNGLRGGFPVKMGNKSFYVYSRKHGDLERDYNYFTTLPQYASQGNGNFRDVLQNRREDVVISPFTEEKNIIDFASLIQPDGYNPLQTDPEKFIISKENLAKVLSKKDKIEGYTIKSALEGREFTPGELLLVLDGIEAEEDRKTLFEEIIGNSREVSHSTFIEGYWCDHFTYIYDLINEYLAIFPDKRDELLFEESCLIRRPEKKILPRKRRYEKTDKGIRQYHFLEDNRADIKSECLENKDGNPIKVSLIEKLILLDLIKFMTLDPYGFGIEMEGGKPGWYDALNGLPGMLGSSVNEAFELRRFINFTIDSLSEKENISLSAELIELINELTDFFDCSEDDEVCGDSNESALLRYLGLNEIKEKYRAVVYAGISGEKKAISANEVLCLLNLLRDILEANHERMENYYDNIVTTYFYYDVTKYSEVDGILPEAFDIKLMPDFLEGSVHALKLCRNREEALSIYHAVKGGSLYDRKLSMYKVNSALSDATSEIGRCRSFTPGWLENESIWLHMEYKYLLELIKNGLYDEFFEDIKTAFIPFMNSDVYGRSILENSSFIASSANPDESIHGKGLVARLSGSTAEFLSMWKMIFFGNKIFTYENGILTFSPAPAIPEYLIKDDNTMSATLFGTTKIIYHFSEKRNYFPSTYSIYKFRLSYFRGDTEEAEGDTLSGPTAVKIRDGEIRSIDIFIR